VVKQAKITWEWQMHKLKISAEKESAHGFLDI